jgi:HD-GYP domain-containing protein (c-di-GMP phosphodiesterase class II)
MMASRQFGDAQPREIDEVLARVPQRAFGHTTWVTLALKGCADHLAPAIASGKSRRIADAIRAIAHAPTPEQVDDVVGAACDTMLSKAYAVRDSRLIANVTGARTIIGRVIGEMRERAELDAVAPAMLRETVDGHVKIVGLVNERLAERLDSVGRLAARIGSVMRLPAPAVLEIELAGRLHDIGTLALPGTTSAADAFDRHAIAGEVFLLGIPSLAHLAPIVRSHHERFDGRGYPDGLRGAEIPLASRIISVAAAFVDLVTESAAQKAVLANDACHQLTLGAGAQFDPDVVAATLDLLNFRRRANRSA